MVVEDLGLAQDGPLAEDAGIEIPDCDLVAVGGALAAVFRDAVRLDLRPIDESFVKFGELEFEF